MLAEAAGKPPWACGLRPVPQVEAVPSRAMPAMSKIAIVATAGAAVTCFVAPGARRVQATTAPALRGQGSTGEKGKSWGDVHVFFFYLDGSGLGKSSQSFMYI